MQETVSRRFLVRETQCQNGNIVVEMTTTNLVNTKRSRKKHEKKKISNKNKEIDDLELSEDKWDEKLRKERLVSSESR